MYFDDIIVGKQYVIDYPDVNKNKTGTIINKRYVNRDVKIQLPSNEFFWYNCCWINKIDK